MALTPYKASTTLAPSTPAVVQPSTRSIRVLQIITRLNVGGPARHTLALGQGLRDRGVDALLVHGSEEPREGSLADLLHGTSLPAVKLAALGRPVQPLNDLRALAGLIRLVFAYRPDVVHTHTAKAGALGRLAALVYNLTRRRSDRCVIVHTYHGHVFTGYFGPLGSRIVRAIERRMAQVTDRVVTVSPRQRQDICERFHIVPSSKTDVLEIGSNMGSLLRLVPNTTLRDRLGLSADHLVFGYVGRLVPIKDLPTLVAAFAHVSAAVPEARLVLVGDGEMRSAIERLVADRGLSDRVHFTGWIRDVASVYGAVDVAVLASINEGTPLVLLEAMAAGRPVIATSVGGVEDIVESGRTGVLVPSGDVQALAKAMIGLARAPERRSQMGERARTAMSERFGRDRLVDEMVELYERALTTRRVPAGALLHHSSRP
jgi:glycosyltransferase involved in cell wall biosynthesis